MVCGTRLIRERWVSEDVLAYISGSARLDASILGQVLKQEDLELTGEEMQRAIEFILQQQAQYAARFERDESRLARLEESFKLLVDLARGADERQDKMGETMAALSHTMNELVQRTITDEARLARLEESFTMLVKLAHKHE